jgi:hypothetical protein
MNYDTTLPIYPNIKWTAVETIDKRSRLFWKEGLGKAKYVFMGTTALNLLKFETKKDYREGDKIYDLEIICVPDDPYQISIHNDRG